jgi:ABC-2 type transport system ATP-binding protein
LSGTVLETGARAAAVSIRDLTRRFGALTAVDGISFDVRPGELFGLVGPDGAGKTTLLRMLAGVLPPDAGDARVLGISVAREPEEVKHQIAYMSQRFGLYADLTVQENLDFYADLYRVPSGERAARLERLYRFSNLAPFRERMAGALSGGMKQKLGLSCALIHQPRVLLLDEPTFGVDPVSRRDLWIIVHEMVARGVTAIVSTAYMDEAERFDRLAFLHRGRVLALETPDRLQKMLAGRLLALRADRLREAREVVAALPEVTRAAVFGEWLHLTVDDTATALPRVRRELDGRGFNVTDARAIEASLEDVFMELVAAAEEAEPPRTENAP